MVPGEVLRRRVDVMGVLPGWMKRNLRKREDGRDVIGITVSYRTVKKVIQAVKRFARKRRKS
jgi:hypothetical protein